MSDYKYLTTDGDGRQCLFEGRPHFVYSCNCKHKTTAEKQRHGMWIYAGTKSIKILPNKVSPPLNPETEIKCLNED